MSSGQTGQLGTSELRDFGNTAQLFGLRASSSWISSCPAQLLSSCPAKSLNVQLDIRTIVRTFQLSNPPFPAVQLSWSPAVQLSWSSSCPAVSWISSSCPAHPKTHLLDVHLKTRTIVRLAQLAVITPRKKEHGSHSFSDAPHFKFFLFFLFFSLALYIIMW